jgi:transcriptional regulator with XRE-family HTH domain
MVRRQRGLTLEALAAAAGLTKSYLSKIERGHSAPSIAAAMKIARSLDVDVAQLFSDEPAADKIVVDRASDGDGRYRAVAPRLLGKTMSPFVVRPTDTAADDPHPTHTGQEFVFVHAGTVELDYGDRRVALTAVDSAYFDASVSHTIRAVGTAPAEVVVVVADEPGSRR